MWLKNFSVPVKNYQRSEIAHVATRARKDPRAAPVPAKRPPIFRASSSFQFIFSNQKTFSQSPAALLCSSPFL
jgi:hypothetical protein